MSIKKISRPEKIIQFGEGNFLRGFVDWIVQIMNETTDFNGSVAIVQPIEKGLCKNLEEQQCVYNLVMRGLKNGKSVSEIKLIDSVSRAFSPYEVRIFVL